MKRRCLAVMVMGGLLAGSTPAPAAQAPLNTTSIPSRYAAQKLAWHQCTDDELPSPRTEDTRDLECTTFTAPMNWERPETGRSVRIAISRLRSTGPATESVLTNPGGPGGQGRTYPASFRNQAKLREHQEIIGIDTRGAGKSSNVTCDDTLEAATTLDARNRDPRHLDLIMDKVEDFTKACRRASGELGRNVDTFHNIRDLDLLRVLLGRTKINWIGVSAGTWLGAHYAQQFPDRAGRFVLDSNTEFTNTWLNSFDWQPPVFEQRWRQVFLPWLARYESQYHFGATAEQARQTYEQIRAKLAKKPVTVGGEPFGPSELDEHITDLLYKKHLFPVLAQVLIGVKAMTEGGSPQAAETAHRAARTAEPVDTTVATQYTVVCNDGRWSDDRRTTIEKSQRLYDQGFPLLGAGWLVQPCVFWRHRPRPLPKMTGENVSPVLMVQGAEDPATPLEGARRAHAAFKNSRMITVTGEGDHGLYAGGNKALDDLVEAYLVDGVVPHDQNIPGMPLPVPAP